MAQDKVAERMTIGIVNQLKVVQINKKEDERTFAAEQNLNLPMHPSTVEQSGQRVGLGLFLPAVGLIFELVDVDELTIIGG